MIPSRPRHRIAPSKALACVLIAAAALLGAVARPAPAAAATPCWKTLLNDWYDGRIDHTYPLHCYQDALHHLPPDVQTYSSAHDDILRALQSAKEKLRRAGHTVTPTTLVPPQTVTTTPAKGHSATKHHPQTTTTVPVTTVTVPASDAGRNAGKGLTRLANQLNPSSPSSLPLPLLVLGGLAILLVAAGAAGLLVKRRQARRPGSP